MIPPPRRCAGNKSIAKRKRNLQNAFLPSTEFYYLSQNVGVFKPAVTMFSPIVSVAVTFLGSGLFHDYCWQVVFYNPTSKFDPGTGECRDTTDPNYCYTPIFGRCTVFFLYVGMIMILQRPVSKLSITKWCVATLPTIVITQLLLIIHLPFVHWYVHAIYTICF